jgi:hypothetical protein
LDRFTRPQGAWSCTGQRCRYPANTGNEGKKTTRRPTLPESVSKTPQSIFKAAFGYSCAIKRTLGGTYRSRSQSTGGLFAALHAQNFRENTSLTAHTPSYSRTGSWK